MAIQYGWINIYKYWFNNYMGEHNFFSRKRATIYSIIGYLGITKFILIYNGHIQMCYVGSNFYCRHMVFK